jgi:hypothetical protein
MAKIGKLTIRFDNGQRWSMPFTGDAATELSEALDQSQDKLEWVILRGPNADGLEQLMVARRGAVQSMMWVEDPDVMRASEGGDLGDEQSGHDEDDYAANGERQVQHA